MNGYSKQYQENQILSSSAEQILLMLYDGAIRFSKQAIIADTESKLSLKLEKISKVFAIITEFSNSLDHEIGGNIAEDLDGLYHFMLRELNKARTDKTGEHLQTVINLLAELRETWAEAIEINKVEQNIVQQSSQNSDTTITETTKTLTAAG